MSAEDKSAPAEQAAAPETEDTSRKAIMRFAQYTAPIMVAMLVSGGHRAAAVGCSPCQ